MALPDSPLAMRYQRQTLLPQIGQAGQEKLAAATVTVIGCGALGTVIAESLARAGVGRLVLCDRDLVEPSNLQRQTLFTEADAASSKPKAIAASERLAVINSDIQVVPKPIDVDAACIETIAENSTILLDGTDNAATRYLLNDTCIKLGRPWIYGAAVATEGRVMPILHSAGPCLRCIFPSMPPPGETATCDTVGVLGPVAGIVANMQAALAIQTIITGSAPLQLTAIDAWSGRINVVDIANARDPNCTCCGQKNFEFLDRPTSDSAALCGRDAVQVRAPANTRWDLQGIGRRLERVGTVNATPFMVRFTPNDRPALVLTAFPDARVIVQGTTDVAEARSVYARYFGG